LLAAPEWALVELNVVRKYGSPPYRVVVIHGGPGAPGYMAPVARELSQYCGVLEPLQSAQSLVGQIEELHEQISAFNDVPFCLVGSSWGATLALFYVSKYGSHVSKVILSGSCVYDSASSEAVKKTREERMSPEDKLRSRDLDIQFAGASDIEKNDIFLKMADCSFEADTYKPLTRDLEILHCEFDTNQKVWSDFKALRDTPEYAPGNLRETFSKIKVPIVNIHGDYDPHLIEGIQPFLESCHLNIRLHTLKKCGHYPWIEKAARKPFFEILLKEINNS
jgi:pimeloyl-ACP methyl ester carboxylesterase